MTTTLLETLKLSDPTQNVGFYPATHRQLPSDYGTINIVATADNFAAVVIHNDIKITTNFPFTRKPTPSQSTKFSNAIREGRMVLVKGSLISDNCNGSSDTRITVIGGGESSKNITVSPNGTKYRRYANAERISWEESGTTKRRQMFATNNADFGHNFLWVPPKTLVAAVIDKNNKENANLGYTLYNGSDQHICFYINRLKRVWSMKMTNNPPRFSINTGTFFQTENLYIRNASRVWRIKGPLLGSYWEDIISDEILIGNYDKPAENSSNKYGTTFGLADDMYTEDGTITFRHVLNGIKDEPY
jgi:hypothetical protein